MGTKRTRAQAKRLVEAKAEEIKINVMNDIKIWMAGRDCDIKVIDDILGKHTKDNNYTHSDGVLDEGKLTK